MNNEDQLIEQEIEVDDYTINHPFDPTKIRVDTRPMSIDLILKRIEYNELDLSPDFQRQEIWNDKAKSRLIESILIRIPLPTFYIDATEDDKWIIIDGLQRLTALKQFISEGKLKLTGLEYLQEIEGKNYSELPRNYQRRILETQIIVYLIEKDTPTAVKYSIFRRINTGGVPLSLQEIRNAIFQGKATKLLVKLADMAEFKKVTKLEQSKRKNRAIDQEFVLGFLAYTINDYQDFSKFKSRDEFFHHTMKYINDKLSENELQQIENKFQKAMIAAYDIFGDKAFRKLSFKTDKTKPLNQGLFEVWSVSLSNLNDCELEVIKQKKQELIDKFKQISDDDQEFFRSISQASEKVTVRFSTIAQLIQEVLND